jgi:outer membrane protein assembly factor BamE
MSIKNKYLLFFILAAGLTGCKQVPLVPGLSAHKIDIQQGNAVTQEMVSKLQLGMTRSQVRFALGTPLLADPFRDDRWDYYYSYTKRGELVEQRRLIVLFKDDKLVRLDGDVIPAKPVPEGAPAEKPKPAAAAVAPETVKPVATPEPVVAVPTPAPAGSSVSVSDKPADSPATQPVAAKPDVKAEEKPKEERGFFGRMLEKIGL